MSIYQFINKYLSCIIFEPPLFYNNEYGIRFELGPQDSEIDDNTYFNVVEKRSSELFNSIFQESQSLFIVGVSYEPIGDLDAYIEGEIDFPQYFLGQIIENFLNREEYDEDTNELTGHYKYYGFECLLSELDTEDLLGILGGFSQKKNYLNSRIYIIEPTSKLVFHIYDNRGLDIVSPIKESLVNLYRNFNNWILEYDREEIDKMIKDVS